MVFVTGILVILLVGETNHVMGSDDIGGLKMSDYYKMPPIYRVDDYDRCFDEDPTRRNVYCYVRSHIKPNASSPLWQIIEEFSADGKHHYRHDHLNRGICLNWCKPHFQPWTRSAKRRYFQAAFDNGSVVMHDFYEGAADDRIMHGEWANLCVNWELKRQYGLMAHSVVEYCITDRKERHSIDAVDKWFAALCVALATLVFISTAFDFHLKRTNILQSQTSSFYETHVPGKFSALAVSFSLPRNWYRLMSDTSTENGSSLKAIHAIRFVTMFCAIVGHASLCLNIIPTMNTQYIERNFYRNVMHVMCNGTIIMQVFIVITGYLMTVQFMMLRRSETFSWNYLWQIVVYRYIRTTPAYVFLILFNATWQVRWQDGWPHVSDPERTFCRANWWTNILYINNIVSTSEPCFQHGWYLAADYQMFVVGVLLHFIFWKFPSSMKYILPLGILVSCIIPGVITYVNEFEGIFMITPENQRCLLLDNPMYMKIYIQAYTNFCGFLCGMIGGWLYDKCKHDQIELRQLKAFVLLWYSALPLCIVLLISGNVFHHYEFTKPALWIAFYAATMKNLFALIIAAFITGTAFGIGGILKDLMCLPIFRPLGRMAYCVYLVHPTVMRVLMGNQRQLMYSSDLAVVTIFVSTLVVSYVLAFGLCLVIEFPVSAMQKVMFDRLLSARVKMEKLARD